MDGKKKILIVDDEPMNIDLLEAILLQEDYEIIAASNGAEAISATRSSPPDLILLDIMMPVMDGYDGGPGVEKRSGYSAYSDHSGHRPE